MANKKKATKKKATKKKAVKEKVTQKIPETQEVNVELYQLDLRTMAVKIVGDTPLIVCKFTEEIDEPGKQKNRVRKTSEEKFQSSRYLDDEGNDVFPAIAVKNCAVRAGKILNLPMTDGRALFQIVEDYVPIIGSPARPRHDAVVIQKARITTTRACYDDWSLTVNVKYNANTVSPQEIINLINAGGFSTGIGAWRPEKSGQFGQFHVEMI